VLTTFRPKNASTQVHEISKTFLFYQEEKMLDKICLLSPPVHDYLVGDAGIAASKWHSTEWLRDTALPPRYGIVSTSVSESSNSMYEEARKLPWLYCLDSVLSTMSSSRISTLRSMNKNKKGVVPECYEKLENCWTTCANYKVFEIEEGCNKHKVTRPMINGYQTNHIIKSMNKEGVDLFTPRCCSKKSRTPGY
jgi:hypothetical protein